MENTGGQTGEQVSHELSKELSRKLEEFVEPLLRQLDAQIDKRLVRTFYRSLQVVATFRNRSMGLLLSELGAYILSPAQAPAGTKRLSNLLRSEKWEHKEIERYLWQCAGEKVGEISEAGELALAVWDESVLEKSESIAIEGLSAVRSSKARRLKRIKPGFYNPPGGPPVFVPGMHWLTVLVMGIQGAPTLAAMRWWSQRGALATERRTVEEEMLKQSWSAWGRQVVHVFDRGYAGGPWLAQMTHYPVRFLLRWQTGYKLVGPDGRNRKPWEITRGKRSMGYRLIWDSRRNCQRKTGIYYCQVSHPEYPATLWLLVSRPGKGRTPWYLLTNEPITTADDAWRLVLAYARRWQIEMTYRFAKCELAMESPRLWFWENRLKLLLMVSLVYAFLLSLLHPSFQNIRTLLLRLWCHRTGERSRNSSAPLSRLRIAISQLWLAHPPPPATCLNPG